MVQCCKFFFSHLKRIRYQYKSFFETENETEGNNTETDELGTNEPPSQQAARFFYELTYQLAKEDLTKYERINKTNLYLCLNTAALLKDRVIKQENEMRKLQAKTKQI